jgi:hypothetical protein
MTKLEIIPSTVEHIQPLVLNLREEDRLEIYRLGLDPVKALSLSYKGALWKRTALINGEVAGMWGLCGTPMSITGQGYLLTSTAATKISALAFSRIYLNEVETMKKIFPVIENYVDSSYSGAVRLLQIAGFQNKGTVMLNNFPSYRFVLEGDI